MASNVCPDLRFERTPGEKLGDEITELTAYINASTCHLLDLIREFDENEYWAEQGFLSCAHWLNFKCGFGMNSAREHIRVAKALVSLPKIRAQYTEGRLSYSKVRAVSRVGDETNEDYLLMMCEQGTAHHVERLVSQYRRAKKLQDPDFAMDQYARREVTWRYDDDGSIVIKARMPADQGEVVLKALDMAMDVAGVRPDAETASTHAVAASAANRRADALADVAETFLNNSDNNGSTADRYQVVFHVRGEPEARPVSAANIEHGPDVSAETSQRIACDCSKVQLTECDHGEPLSIGRKTRVIPNAIRRALQDRDGGCRFPGCTHMRYCDGHHIRHWADGGETCLDNIVLLCRHHHRLVHEGGFDCKRSADGEIYFVDRRSKRLPDYEKAVGITLAESLAFLYRRYADARITSESCSAKYGAGDRIDWDLAVAAMFTQKGTSSAHT